MLADLIKRLGLDRIGDVLAEEVRRLQVQALQEERAVLAKTIAGLDARIAGLGGRGRGRPRRAEPATASPSAPPRKPRRRRARIAPKAGETLKDFVVKVLAKAGGPVKATDLVDLVKQAGYRTSAMRGTLVTSVYRALADKHVFRRLGKGVFALATAPASSRKAVKSARPSTSIARKPGETLQFFVLGAFRKAGGPMGAKSIVKRVLQMGYQTTATPQNLLISVHHVLADGTLFRKAGKGLYALALSARRKGRVGRPKGVVPPAPETAEVKDG